MKVWIIVLNYCGAKDTEECIQSILFSTYKNFEVILIDNASTDDSVPYLKNAFPNIKLIELEENLGYAGGNNHGLKYALSQGGEYFLVLNNDTVLSADCLQEFVASNQKHQNAIIGGKIYQYDHPSYLQPLGGNWNYLKGKFSFLPEELSDKDGEWNETKQLDYVTGCAMFLSKTTIETIGFFEETFFLYYEDSDYCMRAKAKGIPSLVSPSAILWHKESTFKDSKRVHKSYFINRNRLLFIRRNCSFLMYIYWVLTFCLFKFLGAFFQYGYKKGEYIFLYFFSRKTLMKKNRRHQLICKARLAGFIDYFLGTFGKAPPWTRVS